MTREKPGKSNNEAAFTDDKGQGKSGRNSGGERTHLKKGYNPCYKGPNQNRSCTDIICCFLFVVFLAGLAAVACIAYIYGDPQTLIYPQDSNGNLCGHGSRSDRKYLFFFDLSVCGRMGPGVFVNGCPTPQVCVKECPNSYYVFLESVASDTTKLICKDNIDDATKAKKGVIRLVADSDCAPYYFDSKPVLNRCLPVSAVLDLYNAFLAIGKNVSDKNGHPIEKEIMEEGIEVYQQFLNAKEFGEKIVADVVASWWMILIGFLVAMVMSLFWITLMRWLAGFMVWLTIFGFVAIWLCLTAACWYLYFETKGKNETLTFYLVWRLTFEKENVLLAGGIIFGVILIIVLLILLFLCPRIRIAVALIKQGSRAVGAMWSTLLWPVIPFILQVAVVALWGTIATYLASVGRDDINNDNNITLSNDSSKFDYHAIRARTNNIFSGLPCNVSDSIGGELCGFIKYGKGDYTIYLQIFNLFMLFWLVNFVAALGQLTLAGSFASWYWAFDKSKDVPRFPLFKAFYICFRYHLGSLAFGSLLIAIVQLIRTFLDYLDHKLKGSENPVAKFFLKCLKCCFWCLEKFLRFLCKNAFIMMAIYGKNFCRSASKAFKLILANVVRSFVLDKVTDFLLFVCKLVVVGGVGVIAYFFFDGRIEFLSDYNPKLNFYLVPIIIVILGSYIIADIFFSVYEMAVDTVFLCFLEDIERNDGSQEKPYFMGKGLMKILGKKNLKPKKQDK
uniref:Choline transporter-like protein n=1 Tax=Arion vulgaris TaxID=1028688 RepID=A0A0B7AP80_9EUPU